MISKTVTIYEISQNSDWPLRHATKTTQYCRSADGLAVLEGNAKGMKKEAGQQLRELQVRQISSHWSVEQCIQDRPHIVLDTHKHQRVSNPCNTMKILVLINRHVCLARRLCPWFQTFFSIEILTSHPYPGYSYAQPHVTNSIPIRSVSPEKFTVWTGWCWGDKTHNARHAGFTCKDWSWIAGRQH